MLDQSKNNRGFTLAELLMAIAIIMVLAAIAIPSVANAQRNMHMVELDSAANQIALAAQNQMTSMKVSGTWLSGLDSLGAGVVDNQNARQLPNDRGQLDTNDLFFLTAQQISTLGILSSTSIDTAVFAGNYIIEFSRSTATVCGVFYSDGKSSVLNSAITPNAAQAYYDNLSSPAGRNQANRLAANPIVGYYWGTPAGATAAVALENPNIWVDDLGRLCVENTNETDHPEWGTSVQVVIETKDGSHKFVLSGMQNEGTTYSATLEENVPVSEVETFDNDEIYKVEKRDDESVGKNVYKIELNSLLGMLEVKGSLDLQNQIKGFKTGVDIKVTAKILAPNRPCIPSEASANIVWPAIVSKITLLTTASDDTKLDFSDAQKALATERDDKGVKTAFDPISIVPRGSEPLVKTPTTEKEVEDIAIKSTPNDLKTSDPGSEAQHYEGEWISSKDVDNTILFQIKPGNVMTVNAWGTAKYYYYQVYEIWINDILIGSVQGVEWQWNSDYNTRDLFGIKNGAEFQPITNVMPTLSKDNQAIYLDPMKLAETNIPSSEGSYSLYIRSAPAMKDVQEYLNYNAGNIPGNGSARGTDSISASWRKSFLSEFHTSSSVALWTTKMGNITGIPESTKNRDICYYYALTPFAKGKESLDTTALPSSVLWCLETVPSSTELATYKMFRDYIAVGQDYSSVDPPPVGLQDIKQPQVGVVGSADFAILPDTEYLYYRSITYLDEAGNPISGVNAQWVPMVGFDVVNGTPITNADTKFLSGPTKEDNLFIGWNTEKNGLWENLIPDGSFIADYRNILPLGSITLYAQYIPFDIGFMYLEFDVNGNVSGYSGYVGASSSLPPSLPDDNSISSWGYYAVALLNEGGSVDDVVLEGPLKGEASVVTINKKPYKIQAVNDNGKDNTTQTKTFSVVRGGSKKSATYSYNQNFAAALARSGDVNVAQWGKSEEFSWKVRHATQFIGNLKWFSGQKKYLNDYFLQTHDINMLEVDDVNYKFDNTFSGLYDGGSFSIKNIGRATYFINNSGPHGFSVRAPDSSIAQQGQGLFPAIYGDGQEDVVLKNIEIELDKTTAFAFGTLASSNFGLLVGNLENAAIVNCSIEGTADAAIDFKSLPTSGDSVIASLVGWAEQANLTNCSVKNTAVSLDWKGTKGPFRLSLGSMVGQCSVSIMTDCVVEEVSFSTTKVLATPSSSVWAGGIIGRATDLTSENATVKNFSLSLEKETTLPSQFYMGSVVGFDFGGTNCYASQVTAPIQYCISGGAWVSVDPTKVIGNR